jgi:hypothetical protein
MRSAVGEANKKMEQTGGFAFVWFCTAALT